MAHSFKMVMINEQEMSEDRRTDLVARRSSQNIQTSTFDRAKQWKAAAARTNFVNGNREVTSIIAYKRPREVVQIG